MYAMMRSLGDQGKHILKVLLNMMNENGKSIAFAWIAVVYFTCSTGRKMQLLKKFNSRAHEARILLVL
jgi:hypothetical protein